MECHMLSLQYSEYVLYEISAFTILVGTVIILWLGFLKVKNTDKHTPCCLPGMIKCLSKLIQRAQKNTHHRSTVGHFRCEPCLQT